jgi:hypothetical protein
MTEDEKNCRVAHMINNVIPAQHNLEFDGQTCNCGKLLFVAEDCACPNNPHKELRSKPNPSYNFSQQ